MSDVTQTTDKEFLRRADAANYVSKRYGFPCSRQWLAKLAVIGGGPLFRKAGRSFSLTPLRTPVTVTWFEEMRASKSE
jgi:hypothetical protein